MNIPNFVLTAAETDELVVTAVKVLRPSSNELSDDQWRNLVGPFVMCLNPISERDNRPLEGMRCATHVYFYDDWRREHLVQAHGISANSGSAGLSSIVSKDGVPEHEREHALPVCAVLPISHEHLEEGNLEEVA